MKLELNLGGGLAVLGLCILGYGLLQRTDAAHAKPAAAVQGDPPRTVVWMTHFNQTVTDSYPGPQAAATTLVSWVLRGWSDGSIDVRRLEHQWQWENPGLPEWEHDGSYVVPWTTLPDTQFNMACRTDVNHDGTIDARDLAELLGNWGPANCEPVPDIQCPLNLMAVAGE